MSATFTVLFTYCPVHVHPAKDARGPLARRLPVKGAVMGVVISFFPSAGSLRVAGASRSGILASGPVYPCYRVFGLCVLAVAHGNLSGPSWLPAVDCPVLAGSL